MIGSQALNILKQDLKGEIYSVHSNYSFYCLFASGQLLLFHEDIYGIIPFGIAIPGLRHFLVDKKLEKGMGVVCHDLQFYVSEINLLISLEKRETLPNRKKESNEFALEAGILSNLNIATEFLMEKGSKEGLGGLLYILNDLLAGSVEGDKIKALNPFCKSCYKQLICLFAGMAENNYQNMKKSLDGLLGLGIGLTPSMDDLLVGFLCTLCYIRKNMSYTLNGLDTLQALVLSLSHLKTSLISATFLKCAAQGESYTIIDNVIQTILHSSFQNDSNSSFNQLLAVGNNSGKEIFLGIILALRLIFKPC